MHLEKLQALLKKHGAYLLSITIITTGIVFFITTASKQEINRHIASESQLSAKLKTVEKELNRLKNQDQVKINKNLQTEIDNIQKTYKTAVKAYESLLELKAISKNTAVFDKQFAKILTLLSERNYTSASAELVALNKSIGIEQDKLAAKFTLPTDVTQSNNPPGSGYSRQKVTTDIGTYLVDIIAADLSSTRVIVDTASENTCPSDCPVLPLSEYVSRNNAFAGINGSYFCPAEYPSCSGKTNSFDTLLMNKNKVYFNSDNNVYSVVPAVIFGNGWIRFVQRSLEWGRATDVDGVLANQPLLVAGGNVVFSGDGDPKKGSKGNRSFVAHRGSVVYIGVVRNATVAESAIVLKTLGMENALNLDSGGSTALWYGGYKVGPGRNIPNAILFVRK
jgi:exopolysaccharide biosynthesis protein